MPDFALSLRLQTSPYRLDSGRLRQASKEAKSDRLGGYVEQAGTPGTNAKCGRAKNSARRWCCFAIWLIRAGFEPRPSACHALKSHADQASQIKGTVEMPPAENGSKPARINSFTEQHRGRAEFFALPRSFPVFPRDPGVPVRSHCFTPRLI
jgi:hypothetical protein